MRLGQVKVVERSLLEPVPKYTAAAGRLRSTEAAAGEHAEGEREKRQGGRIARVALGRRAWARGERASLIHTSCTRRIGYGTGTGTGWKGTGTGSGTHRHDRKGYTVSEVQRASAGT